LLKWPINTALLEVAARLEATTIIEEEAAAASEARQPIRPGRTIFVDGSRLEN